MQTLPCRCKKRKLISCKSRKNAGTIAAQRFPGDDAKFSVRSNKFLAPLVMPKVVIRCHPLLSCQMNKPLESPGQTGTGDHDKMEQQTILIHFLRSDVADIRLKTYRHIVIFKIQNIYNLKSHMHNFGVKALV